MSGQGKNHRWDTKDLLMLISWDDISWRLPLGKTYLFSRPKSDSMLRKTSLRSLLKGQLPEEAFWSPSLQSQPCPLHLHCTAPL